MTNEEKTAWTSAISASAGLLAYLVFALAALVRNSNVKEIDFSLPLLGCMFGIVIPIWLMRGSLLRTAKTQEVRLDERDRDIALRGDQARHQILLLTCVIVLALALNQADYFWLAGTVFAGVSLSFVTGAAVQISGYRNGFHAL